MTHRALPHETERRFLAYAGTGTDLIFNRGIDLPGFASFPLVNDEKARPVLVQQMRELIDVARASRLGAILDTPTWMANRDRAATLGYGEAELEAIIANASRCSHAELDESTELDDGDPVELGAEVAALVSRFPALSVLGGCCGTDMRHMDQIAKDVTA